MDNIWNIALALFASGFVSGSLLPGNSEIAFVAALAYFPEGWQLLLLAVFLGNSLGGVFTYFLGFYNRMLFPKLYDKLLKKVPKYARWVERYGAYTALVAWVPVIGDPLIFVLGTFKTKPALSMLFMAVGKLLRYGFICYAFYMFS